MVHVYQPAFVVVVAVVVDVVSPEFVYSVSVQVRLRDETVLCVGGFLG